MNQDKLKTISNLFEGKEIRSIWDSEKEEYYFSVVDVINALAEPKEPRKYWNDLKRKLHNEGSELSEKIGQLKMKSLKDGKMYNTDTLDTAGIFRLIESIPSPKAEPFKVWLANLGSEKIDEVFDPSKGIDQMIDIYLKKGYTLEWIEARIKAIIDRKKLTKDFVLNINSVFPKADIGFFIDITPEESVNRNTDTKFNIKSSVEHLGEVRKAYSSILNENNLIYIDGMKPIEQIFNDVLQKLEEFRKNNAKRI